MRQKCRVVFELVPNGVPRHFWLRVILREFGDQDVKAVIDSAALVMQDVIIVSHDALMTDVVSEKEVKFIARHPVIEKIFVHGRIDAAAVVQIERQEPFGVQDLRFAD